MGVTGCLPDWANEDSYKGTQNHAVWKANEKEKTAKTPAVMGRCLKGSRPLRASIQLLRRPQSHGGPPQMRGVAMRRVNPAAGHEEGPWNTPEWALNVSGARVRGTQPPLTVGDDWKGGERRAGAPQ